MAPIPITPTPAAEVPGGRDDPGPHTPEELEVALLRTDPSLPAPAYARPGDAGADLCAREDVELPPGGRRTVPTGVALALPEGYAGFVHPRSGLAARHGVTVLNAPGTVDAGYRGEILVTLLNTDPEHAVTLRRGDRIAQLVVQRVARVRFVETDALPPSERGAQGFGSTGGVSPGGSRLPAGDLPGGATGPDPGRGETA